MNAWWRRTDGRFDVLEFMLRVAFLGACVGVGLLIRGWM